jgi:Domain of unknown function (DUF4149)
MTPAARYVRVFASLLCAAAVGALLFSVQVATMVFRELSDDRLRAGRVAGHAFAGAYGITAVAAVIALAVVWGAPSPRTDRVVSFALALIGAAQLFWITPAIASHGVGWPGTFASLHATGGVLHLALALLALVLAWRLLSLRD